MASTVICTVIAIIISFYIVTPIYRSNTVLYVASKAEKDFLTYANMQVNNELVNDYRELIKSRLVNTTVISELGLDGITPDELAEKLSATFKQNTRIMVLSSDNENRELSMKIANKVAEVFKRKVVDIMNVENVQIIDTAILPNKPYMPNKQQNVFVGAFLGLMLGLAIVFMIEYLDGTIRTEEDIKKQLEIPVLGDIPKFNEDDKKNIKVNLLTSFNQNSLRADAYKILRTNIQFSKIDKPVKIIAFTSSTPEEGKTTTSINTAIAFAQSEKKTLLIDCDLRRPKVHKFFNIHNDKGIVNVLTNNVTEDYKEYIYKSEVKNLDILPVGVIPPNPSEMLASRRMKDFLDRIKENYDMVIIDTPPVGIVTDATILGKYIDGMIIVISSGKVDVEMSKKTKNDLQKVGVDILGAIINKTDTNKDNDYYRLSC